MSKYICQRCGYNTNRIQNLKRHILRKNLCKPVLNTLTKRELFENFKMNKHDVNAPVSYQCNTKSSKCNTKSCDTVNPKVLHYCNYCNKAFQSRQGKYKHIKFHCKEKERKYEKKLLENKLEDMIIKYSKLEKENEKIKNDFKELKERMRNFETTTINIGKLSYDNTIIVNNYGSENLDYITDDNLKRLLKYPSSGIEKLIGKIHFNPDHPENHNIRITNKKLKFAEVKKNNKWLLQHKKKTLSDLIEKGKEQFENLIEKDCIDKNLKNKYKKMDIFLTDNKKRNIIKNNLEISILNGTKNIIDNDITI